MKNFSMMSSPLAIVKASQMMTHPYKPTRIKLLMSLLTSEYEKQRKFGSELVKFQSQKIEEKNVHKLKVVAITRLLTFRIFQKSNY